MQQIWQMIVKYLKDNGIDAYAPGTHKEKCTSPYVVVKTTTTTRYLQYSTRIMYIDMMCYGRTMSETNELVDKVTETLKGMSPIIKPTQDYSIPFYDDDVKAWLISVTYRNYAKYYNE